MSSKIKKLENFVEPKTIEFRIDEKNAAIVKRQILGKTERDLKIEQLEIPKKVWLRIIIFLIRFYQRKIAGKLGNRCVFDPSCSHYSELAYRKKGFLIGTWLTIKRIYKCRPENGGIDDLD